MDLQFDLAFASSSVRYLLHALCVGTTPRMNTTLVRDSALLFTTKNRKHMRHRAVSFPLYAGALTLPLVCCDTVYSGFEKEAYRVLSGKKAVLQGVRSCLCGATTSSAVGC